MKNFTSIILFSLTALCLLPCFSANAQYCTSAGSSCGGNYIISVTFAGINNGPQGCAFGTQYSNYTNGTPASVTQGSSYSLIVGIATNNLVIPAGATAWIDWDQNGIFDNSEIIGPFNQTPTTTTCSTTVAVPATAFTGSTRFRIRLSAASAPSTNPCGTEGYEVEDYRVNVSSVTSPSPPSNDDCVNATALTPATSCSNTPGTTTNATEQFAATTCSGNTVANANEVWYKFTADGTSSYIISVTATGTFNPVLGLYQDCSGTSLITCTDATGIMGTESITAGVLTGSVTYYYRIYGNGGAGTFTTCVTIAGSPSYCAATGPCAGVNGSNAITNVTVAGENGGFNNNTGCDFYGNYTYLVSNMVANTPYAASTTSNDAGYYAGQISVWIDWNNNSNFDDAGENVFYSSTNSGAVPFVITPPVGTSLGAHRMRIRSASAVPPLTPCGYMDLGEVEDYTINIIIPAPPANDDCVNAITINPASTCNNTAGSTTNSTQQFPPGNCSGNTAVSANDVWYKFTADGSSSYIVSVSGTGGFNPVLALYSDCAGTLIFCSDTTLANGTESIQAGVLTAGIYSYRIYGNGANGAFTTCVIVGTPGYCSASGATCGNGNDRAISFVDINTINNSSSCSPTGYSNFTYISTSLNQGSAYPVQVTINGINTADIVAVYIDWNQDGTFNSTDEYFALGGNAGNFAGTVNVPGTATLGNTRMRIRFSWGGNGPSNPCGTSLPGEVEDYTVNVIAPPPPTPPANDNCANAITLTPSSTCSNTAGTTVNATQQFAPDNCSSNTAIAANDVWYKFTADGTTAYTVSVTGTAGFNPVLGLYSDCSGTLISCKDSTFNNGTENYEAGMLTAGIYYYRIYGNGVDGTFTTCVTYPGLPSPPANDDCANAFTITPNTTCSNTAGTTVNATQQLPPSNCSNHSAANANEVWYKFTANGTTDYTISVTGTGTFDPVLGLYSDCSGTLISCKDSTLINGTETINAGVLTSGIYYYRIYGNGADGTFTTCVTFPAPPPANDNCANAFTLAPAPNCSNTAGTTVNSTQQFASTSCSGNTAANANDVWYKFTADGIKSYTVSVTGTGTFNPVLGLYSACSSGALISCADATLINGTENISAGVLTAGIYYYRIYGNGADGTFTTCVTYPAPASYCQPAGGCDPRWISVNIAAGQINNPDGNCFSGYRDYTANPVWGTATVAPGSTFAVNGITTPNYIGGASNTVFVDWNQDGDFADNGEFMGAWQTNTPGGISVVVPPTATLGITRLRMRAQKSISQSPCAADLGETDDYKLIISGAAAPSNNNCANAISIATATTCNNTAGTSVNATQQFPPTACSGNTAANANDVWYKFVANGSRSYTISVTGTGGFNPVLGLYSSCSEGALISCTDATLINGTENINAGVLTAATYYYRIYGNGTDGTFTTCVTYISNDNCATATTISTSTTCSNTAGTTINSTQQFAPTTCNGNTAANAKDVWYKFTADGTKAYTISVTGTGGFNPVLGLYSSCSSGALISCADATLINGTETIAAGTLTAGIYYYRIYGNGGDGTFTTCVTFPGYCTASGNCVSDYIISVQLSNVNNSSGCSGGYTNYSSSQYAQLQTGGTNTININRAANNFVDVTCSVWIDWNKDFDFADAGEQVASFAGIGNYSGVFLTSSGSVTGDSTRMRIRLTAAAPPAACGFQNVGEVEDYGIVIVSPPSTQPPSNDNCTNAITIMPNTTCSNTAGTTVNAMQQFSPTTCSSNTAANANDVWYKFTADGIKSYTVSVTGTVGFNPVLGLYSSCSAGALISCADATLINGTENISAGVLTAGIYYYRIYGNGGDGTFTTCVTYPGQPSYCAASGDAGCVEVAANWIGNVTSGSINNSSGCGLNAGYSDYTYLSTSMQIGSTYNMTFTTSGVSDPGDIGAAWIDWNADGDFADPDETLTVAGTGTGTSTVAAIIPPSGAVLGDTRMRIRIRWGGTVGELTDPCGDTQYGEVEDYTINVTNTPPPPPSGYCAASGNGCFETDTDPIINVTLAGNNGGINNNSGCEPTGYGDYTNLISYLTVGNPYTAEVHANTQQGFFTSQIDIWIDYNNNFSFDDAGEHVATGSCAQCFGNAAFFAATITPPPGTTQGYKRLRVRSALSDNLPTSCGFSTAGEVEDYTVFVDDTTVANPPSCATLVSPTNSALNLCPDVTLNWADGGGAPTGYKLYFGTDNPPTNLNNGTDLGNVTSYDSPGILNANTTYFWKIVPYNSSGDAFGCTQWSFSTAEAPTVTATATPSSVCSGGTSQLCAAIGGASTQVYHIGLGDLVNVPNNCGGGSYYSDCGAGTPGFTWSDVGTGTIESISIQLGIGVDCNGSGVSHNITLNGNGVGSFTPTGNWCSCGFINNVVTINPSTTGYNVGGANTLVFSSGGTCFGFINGTTLGADYAVITVTYNAASCSSSGGETFLWTPATFLNDATIQSPIASGVTTTTTYTVTVTNSAGCSSTSSATVTVEALVAAVTATPPPSTITFTGTFVSGVTPTTACTDWNTFRATLTPQAFSKLTIKGSNDATGVFTTDPAVIGNIAAALLNNTAYSAFSNGRTWSVGGCGGGSELNANTGSICSCDNPGYTVRPCIGNSNWGGINGASCGGGNQTMTVEFEIGSSGPPCPGGTWTLDAAVSGGGTPYTYAWSGPGLTTSNTASVTAIPPGGTSTYTVTVTNGCSNSVTSTVTTTTVDVSASVSPASSTICSGQSQTLTASGSASTFTWSPATGLNTTTGSTVTASPNTTTTYTVTAASNGCTATATAVVNVNPTPTVSATATPSAVCSGGTSQLAAITVSTQVYNIGLGNLVNLGSNCGSTGSQYNGCSGSAGFSWTDIGSGTVSGISITFAVGVECAAGTKNVSLNSVQQSPTFTDINNCVCDGMASGNTFTLTWSPTNYNVGSANTFLVMNPSSCFGLFPGVSSYYAVVTVTYGTAGGTTFAWNPATFLDDPGIQNPVASGVTSTTTYTVTATNNGCTSSAQTTVTVNPNPAVTVSPDITICQGQNTTLTASGASTYEWTPSTDLSSSTGSSVTATPASTTTYTVTGTDGNGCTASAQVTVTVNPNVTYYEDADNDTYGNPSVSQTTCTGAPAGYVTDNTDCNDANNAVHPGATEVCNGTDDDCNGLTDDADPGITGQPTWYADADNDGYGNNSVSILSCTQPSGYVSDNTDCNDADNSVHAPQTYYADTDNDGFGDAGNTATVCSSTPSPGYVTDNTDCNDNNAAVNPGATEVCNGIDDDCDSFTDDADPSVTGQSTWYADNDFDGYGAGAAILACTQPANTSTNNTDCNDNNAAVNPGATEVCNGIDDDCDSFTDDADPSVTGQSTWYADNDFDGYGAGAPILACTQPSNTSANNSDCNDNNAAVNPGATEVCNGIDDDCDSFTDDADPSVTGQSTWYADNDFDGYGAGAAILACTQPSNTSANNSDCNDNNAAVNPGATEVCNGIDDDCDTFTDDADPSVTGQSTWYADNDFDGYGAGAAIFACTQPANTSTNNTDCNDNNAAINPGATEVCNGIDDDCDSFTDDADPSVTGQSTWYADNDFDGYGAGTAILACTQPANTSSNNTDCNDNNAAVNPGASEVCNGIDDDCDSFTDEGVQSTFYADADNDGYGNASVTTLACTAPSGYVSDNTDCNDNNAAVNPGATEVCNGIDDDCDSFTDEGVQSTFYADADNDGYGNASVTTLACTAPSGYVSDNTDCNDNNAAINPGATEVCNGIDDDCDSFTDEGVQSTFYADADNDGYGNASVTTLACTAPSGYVSDNTDCNDNNAAVNPGATEVCNGIDDDCDSFTDEGVQSTFYADADNDGYGNAAVTTLACTAPSGYVSNSTDCNDNNAAVNPGATEVCNGIDDDCDSFTDDADPSVTGQSTWYADNDFDGYGAGAAILACTQPANTSTNNTDCNDNNAAVNPGATEVCNGIDDDCDSFTDEGVQSTFYADADNDGYGNSAVTTQACTAPSGYVSNNTDCNDANNAVHPGATETCNGIDDDCSGQVDNGLTYYTYYADNDNDGYGNASSSISSCVTPTPSGYSSNNTDCNDNNSSVHSMQQYYVDADLDGYGSTTTAMVCATSAPSGYSTNNTDCNDNNANIHPGATESCENSVDDDCDGQTNEGCGCSLNVKPVVTGVSFSTGDVMPANSSTTMTVNWNDEPNGGPYTVDIDWNDGTPHTFVTVSGSSTGFNTASAAHTYTLSAVYEPKARVTDGCGAVSDVIPGISTYQYLAVYVTGQQFTTAGGWFSVPNSASNYAGAHANIGDVIKKQGNNFKGQIELNIQGNNFKAHTDNGTNIDVTWDYLTIQGCSLATARGACMVNNVPGYKVLVAQTDKNYNLTTGNRVRVKVWRLSDGQVMFDTQPGAGDNAMPTTVMAGGSIKVNMQSNGPCTTKMDGDEAAPVNEVRSYPNPFSSTTTITYAVVNSGNYKLEIFNSIGEKISELFNGYVEGGTQQQITFDPVNTPEGIYFSVLSGEGTTTVNKMTLMK